MGAIGDKVKRNKAIDQGRLFAALLVIFIHSRIPWIAGDVILTIARIAVPFFFMVSGYYAYPIYYPTIFSLR